MTTNPADVEAIIASFLQRYFADRKAGRAVSLAEYEMRYPGYERVIATEFAQLTENMAGDHEAGNGALAPTLLAGTPIEPLRGAAAERYRDDGEIARGGMGTIHRVWDPSLRRTVAKKVLVLRGEPGGGGLLRFLEEAQVTAQLDHPGIVPVHELGVDASSRYYFTMPLLRGDDFGKVIDRVHANDPAWSLPRALGVLQRICDAVAFAHDKGVIHRDLKPANIMVGRFGEAYVMDWGLARVGDVGAGDDVAGLPADATAAIRSPRHELLAEHATSPFLTRDGDVVGTPAYMSPEQAAGDTGAIGPRSDVYALGAILYHLVAGRMPYADEGSTTWQEVLEASRSRAPRPLQSLAAGTPAELHSICDKAMARDPACRYATAKALGQDLGAFLEGRVVHAHATGALVELRKWVQRNRLAAAAAAVALVSLAAGLGTSLHLGRQADHQARLAEAGYLGALDAVERMFNRVAASELRHIPGTETVRRQLMEDAAQLLERFVDERRDRDEGRSRLGRTYGQLGAIHGNLGNSEQERTNVERAVAIYSRIVTEEPESAADWINLAVWQKRFARIADREDRPDEAVSLLMQLAGQLDELIEKQPGLHDLDVQRANCDTELALVHHRRGRLQEALLHTEAAYRRLDRWFPLPDASPDWLGSFLATAIDYATSLAQHQRGDEAEPVLMRVQEALAVYHDADPRSADLYEARALLCAAFIAQRREHWSAAAAALEQAIRCLRELTNAFPHDPANWVTLSQSLHNLALAHAYGNTGHDALGLVDEALTIDRSLLQRDRHNRPFLDQTFLHLKTRIGLLMVRHDYASIDATIDEMVLLEPANAARWRKVGEILWDAGKMALTDVARTDDDRRALLDRYVQRGADCVRRSFEIAGGSIDWLATAYWDRVRDHPAFAALVGEVQAKAVDGVVPAGTGR